MLFWMHRCLYGTETLGAAPEHGDGLNIWPLEAPSSHLLLWCCPKKTLLGQPLKPASVARRMFLQVSLYLILSRNWALKGWRVWRQWYPKQSRRTSEGAPAAQRPMVYGVGDARSRCAKQLGAVSLQSCGVHRVRGFPCHPQALQELGIASQMGKRKISGGERPLSPCLGHPRNSYQ